MHDDHVLDDRDKDEYMQVCGEHKFWTEQNIYIPNSIASVVEASRDAEQSSMVAC